MRGKGDDDEDMASAGDKTERDGKRKGKDKGKRKAPRVVKAFLGENGFVYGMTLDDVQAQVSSAFEELDSDGSGVMTRGELRPAMEALRGS